MTEAEWLACNDPATMLEGFWGKASDRKLRLCASGWARLIVGHFYRNWLGDPHWLAQLTVAEQFADGLVGRQALRSARLPVGGPYNVFRNACRVKDFSLGEVYRSLQSVQSEYGIPLDREVCDVIRDL